MCILPGGFPPKIAWKRPPGHTVRAGIPIFKNTPSEKVMYGPQDRWAAWAQMYFSARRLRGSTTMDLYFDRIYRKHRIIDPQIARIRGLDTGAFFVRHGSTRMNTEDWIFDGIYRIVDPRIERIKRVRFGHLFCARRSCRLTQMVLSFLISPELVLQNNNPINLCYLRVKN